MHEAATATLVTPLRFLIAFIEGGTPEPFGGSALPLLLFRNASSERLADVSRDE